jgi:short-subunit dehydrogenase/peroxiredoxin
MNFKDQVILITGASTGIGRCLAIDLAARGATVVGCARSGVRLEATFKDVRRAIPSSIAMECDVGDRAQVHAMISKVLTDFGKIDILVNNAGIGMRKPFAEASVEQIENVLRTNYLGMVYCTHEALPSMIARRSGHIVNISSVSGKIGTPNTTAYTASKFAMNGFSESLYYELKPLGINVTVVCPGPVRTEFNQSFADIPPKSPPGLVMSPEAVSTAVIKAIEAKRFEIVLPRLLAIACWVKRMTPGIFRAVAYHTFRSGVVYKQKLTWQKENSMLLRVILFFVFTTFISGFPAFGQLGPKDGANLSPTELNRIKVGEKAPDFTLEDADGKNISLSDFRGKKSLVLVFYRGYWWPFCIEQLGKLKSLLTKQQKEKVQILAVSVDSHGDSKKLAQMMQNRFEGEFDFPLLEDKDHKVIDRYGVYNPDGKGWPHPTTLVIDPHGVVRWKFVEVDYKKRASNEQIRQQLAKIK